MVNADEVLIGKNEEMSTYKAHYDDTNDSDINDKVDYDDNKVEMVNNAEETSTDNTKDTKDICYDNTLTTTNVEEAKHGNKDQPMLGDILSPIDAKEKRTAVAGDNDYNDGYNDTVHDRGNADYNVDIGDVMINNNSASTHQLGREAATSHCNLDGDLYQNHPVTDHFVPSVAIDLLPFPVLNEFDGTKDGDEVKPAGKIKEIGNCKSGIDEDNPPSFKEHQLGRELSCKDPPDIVVQVHTIDFAEAYDQVQVVIVLTTLDDVYNHPDLIHRDKWHTAIEREL